MRVLELLHIKDVIFVKIIGLDVICGVFCCVHKFSLIKEPILVTIKIIEISFQRTIDFLFVNHSHYSSVEVKGRRAFVIALLIVAIAIIVI
jgi:hypothetical protein